jgi:steroid 5-alpha reductase family enzyme
MDDLKSSKAVSLSICLGAYVTAAAVAVGAGYLVRHESMLFTVAAADLAGTMTIFLFSLTLNNSSLYDPYWSVAPIFIAGFYLLRAIGGLAVTSGAFLRCWLTAILVAAWGLRLTLNWITRWKGLKDEDWRYRGFRASSGRWYWMVSFLAIHFLPTVIVYLGCLPLYYVFVDPMPQLTPLDIIALVVTSGAIAIETISDIQLRRFTSQPANRDRILRTGLWRYSRHPNYFGEVLFWTGIFLFASRKEALWTIIGPVAMTLLFFLVSIPMMERRLTKTKPDYKKATRGVSPLIPWIP